MAATERTERRERLRRRARRALQELPWIAAGLGSLTARDALGQSSLDTKLLFYKESGGRTQVLNPLVLLHQDFGEATGNLDLLLAYDTISGASPSGAYPTADVTTSASGHTSTNGSIPQVAYSDDRKSASLSYGRKFGAHLPTVDLSYGKENDYVARGIGLSDAWTVAGGRGTIHLGASIARDLVQPVTNSESLAKRTNGFSLGFTWILGERDLVDLSGSLMQLSGYLDDPYKIVPVGKIGTAVTAPDHRPDSRSRRAIVLKYGHHFEWDGALKATYRFYTDDWSIQSHTLELTYDHRLDDDWVVTPQVRLYTQTGASFYTSLAAAPQTYLSSDYRLSPLGSVLGGLTVTHRIDDALSVNLGATLQSQSGRDRVTPIVTSGSPRNAGTTSAADLVVTTIVAGFTWKY